MVARLLARRGVSTLRLETLIRIRWLAIIGQTVTVLTVAFALGYEFRLAPSLGLIAASAWLNLILRWRYPISTRLNRRAALALLSWDIVQLSLLLFLTGGLQNPFSVLLVVPVIISATTQGHRQTLPLGALTIAAATLLAFVHEPLPWPAGRVLELPFTYVVGMWVAVVATLVFTAFYAWRVADEARKLADALAATELVLAREQHLSALDGLAAAAAHELGTPLGTIALVSKEMMRELPADSPLAEDARLLRAQAERCREILAKLSSLSEEGDSHIGHLPLSSLMEEVAAPHREIGVAITLEPGAVAGEPVLARNPAVLYGLGNLLENAVDFASGEVQFGAEWDERRITLRITDDGPGFAREMQERLGEPFMTTRPAHRAGAEDERVGGGLGLGMFIAKTLLERSGATLRFANRGDGRSGAAINVIWQRAAIDLTRGAPGPASFGALARRVPAAL